MTHRILIVDDDLHIREVIRVALKKAGMAVSEARDGKEALGRFANDRPDLVVLDIGMPEFDGLDVCREIRKSSDVPILFLSARDEEIDRILGLEIGGDDYVTKPFSPRELVARVTSVLRRARHAPSRTPVFTVADVTIDADRMRVERNGAAIDLTPTEFLLLAALARYPGRVCTRAQLLDAVRGTAVESFERAIDAHVKNIRRKIEPDPHRPRYLLTVYGIGYKFAE